MKKLVLVRHAKSSWDDPFLADHSRPLAGRGLRDAPKMAKRLKGVEIFPDAILSSDAERAKATALIIADGLDFPKKAILFKQSLYMASSASLLEEVRRSGGEARTLFVVSHNPGLNDLIWRLGGDIENLPTTGIYGIKFDVKKWVDIHEDNAKFWFVDFPKNH